MSGPLPSYLSPLTVPASWLYGRVIAARQSRFDQGKGITTLDRPVFSVGNMTTGGTGKTPMVAWIAEQLVNAGWRPVIAMRGYKADGGGISDEQAEYAARLPQIPVVAHADRIAALKEFFSRHSEIDCVILDDGFQHRQIKRDLDVVLIDASVDTFADRLLPAGNLREPIANLKRADAVIVTHADRQTSKLESEIKKWHGRPPLAWSRHAWPNLHFYQAPMKKVTEPDVKPVTWLAGKRVLTMFGIGNPKAALDQIVSVGSIIAVNIPCADHERFDTAKIAVARGLAAGCDAMIVTGKDWVKLRDLIDLSRWPVPIVVPQLVLDVFDGAESLRNQVLQVMARR